MTRRFAAGVATGILITGLVGVAVAAARTPTSSAAGPSSKTGGAHNGTSVGTHQSANRQQGRGGAVRIRVVQGGPGGEFGFGGGVMRKGGAFTVTAINGNTITATLNGFGPLQVRVDPSGPGPSDGPGAASGTVVVGGPGANAGPGLGSDAPVSVTHCQIITATSNGPGFGFQGGGPGPVFKRVFPLGGQVPMTVTITVNATTVYTRADQAASLSDVHVGSLLDVQGTPTGDGAISASAIRIVLPQRSGVVTAVNGNNLTVTSFDARTYTIAAGSSTVYHRAGQTAALSDIAVGSLIYAEGDLSSDGSTLNALSVTIQLPSVKGQISAVSGNTVTVNSPDGTTSTVLLTDATTYTAGPQGTADKSSVTTGSFIMAEGTLGSDGTLTALRVDIATGFDAGGGPGIKFAPPPGAGPICIPGGDATTSAGPTS
jgi:hypothetical protein